MVPIISKPQFRLSSKAELKRPPLLLAAPDVALPLEEDERVLHQKGEQRFLIHKVGALDGRGFCEMRGIVHRYPKLAAAMLKMAKQVHVRKTPSFAEFSR